MKATALAIALVFIATSAQADGPATATTGLSHATKTDDSDPFLEELAHRFDATKDLTIPEPAKTPFDSDSAARQAYLTEYRLAYRQMTAGFETTCPLTADTPHRDAIEAGHRAGTLAAEKQRALKAEGPGPEEVARRFASTKDLPVPEPAKTPFDADPAAREVYLVEYRRAYRQMAAGFEVECELVAGIPYREAIIDGHGAGVLAAFKDGAWQRAKRLSATTPHG
jgi:hypothetical protein